MRIEKLQRAHAVDSFDCRQPELDRFLIRHALQAQQMNSSQTYGGLSGNTIVAGEVRHSDAPTRVSKGMPRPPIPLLILARLAVHCEWQGCGIGAGLLLDALGRTLQVADIIGTRALAVHAKDESVAAFYRHFGYILSPTDKRHLFILIKDIRTVSEW